MTISTHAPLAGRDGRSFGSKSKNDEFQPTRPLRGATLHSLRCNHALQISTHAPLAGRDDFPSRLSFVIFTFQPTRPLRGATRRHLRIARALFISTHAPLAGRDFSPIPANTRDGISTHAPLAGRDVLALGMLTACGDFNPRAPCGARLKRRLAFFPLFPISTHAPLAGRDRDICKAESLIFISTHAPLAGRDGREHRERPGTGNFNPRAPCGARRFVPLPCSACYAISTHAPLAGRDARIAAMPPIAIKFQPTRPLRGATFNALSSALSFGNFNPRAPCGARRTPDAWTAMRRRNFNPRAPCGARRTVGKRHIISPFIFQPTRPLRGATKTTMDPLD